MEPSSSAETLEVHRWRCLDPCGTLWKREERMRPGGINLLPFTVKYQKKYSLPIKPWVRDTVAKCGYKIGWGYSLSKTVK